MEGIQLEETFAGFHMLQASVYISDGFPHVEVIVRSLVEAV